jgi:hypothetical protein
VAKPITAEERQEIIRAIRSGCSRNEIARQFKRSPSVVTGIAKAEGLNFDRSMTKKATEARQADRAYTREHRLDLIDLGLQKHRELLDSCDTPHKMQAWWIGLGIAIDKRRGDEQTDGEVAELDRVLAHFDRMADEYERTLQPEAGLEHSESDGTPEYLGG